VNPRPRPVALEWFALLAGISLLLRQAWLLDDAFIYFRYADNLLYLGRGLVYNQGEWVEGYSSPLWMLTLLLLRATQLDWWMIVRLAGVVLFALAWWGMVRARWLWSERTGRDANLPLLYLALCYPVQCYWTSGLETPLVQLAAVVTVLAVLETEKWRWQVLLSLAILVRHELLLPWLVVAAWIAWRDRRLPLPMLASAAALVLGWAIVRVWLYAELLPNTFYLKDDSNYLQGLKYLWQVTWAQGLIWMAIGVGFIAFRLRAIKGMRWRERGVLLLACVSSTAYAIKVGGDMMYYRFLAYPFVLGALACGGLAREWRSVLPKRLTLPARAGLTLGCAAFALLAIPPQLDRNPLLGNANTDEKSPVLVDGINDANSHRKHPDLSFSPWTFEPVLEQRTDYRRYRKTHPHGEHSRLEVQGWCFQSYREFDVEVVQRWGLTDPFLARVELPWQRPGHRFALVSFAERLVTIREEARAGKRPEDWREMFVAGHVIPTWARRHLDEMAILEAKRTNRQNFFENLQLSFRFVGNFD